MNTKMGLWIFLLSYDADGGLKTEPFAMNDECESSQSIECKTSSNFGDKKQTTYIEGNWLLLGKKKLRNCQNKSDPLSGLNHAREVLVTL